MSKRVKIGVAGAGAFGGHHASKYAKHGKSELTAIFDPDGERASGLADIYHASATSDYDAFLDNVDAVVIAAPAKVHYHLATRALSKSKHVFVEKPLATSLEHADALIDKAESRGLVLQVGHQERYVFDAAGLLNFGAPPKRIECRRCAPATGRGLDVSAVFDMMIHDLDLVRQLTSSNITNILASGDDDETDAELILDNGVFVQLCVNRRAPAVERRIKLAFDDGEIAFDFVNRKITNSTPNALSAAFESADAPMAFQDPLGFGADGFLTAILADVDPVVTGRHGRAAIEWALMIEDAKAKTSVSIPVKERLRA